MFLLILNLYKYLYKCTEVSIICLVYSDITQTLLQKEIIKKIYGWNGKVNVLLESIIYLMQGPRTTCRLWFNSRIKSASTLSCVNLKKYTLSFRRLVQIHCTCGNNKVHIVAWKNQKNTEWYKYNSQIGKCPKM